MGNPTYLPLLVGRAALFRGCLRGVQNQSPGAIQKSIDPLNTFVAPVASLVPRTEEHQVSPNRVRAERRDEVVRIHHVPAGLRHPSAVSNDETLVEQTREGFA